LRCVKIDGTIFLVYERIGPPSAEHWLEEARAEEKLAQMELVEDLAMLVETETCPRLRRQMAEQYRKAIGVDPAQREELRVALIRAKTGGGMPVADVVDWVGRDYHTNGSV
jgi:hypothetical protein